jgi:hypothetical protein
MEDDCAITRALREGHAPGEKRRPEGHSIVRCAVCAKCSLTVTDTRYCS